MNADIKDIKLAKEGKLKIEWADQQMPVVAIIRKQFEKHNVDFKNPSKKDLYKITDTLVEVTLSIKGENVAREEKKIFKDLLLKLNGSE